VRLRPGVITVGAEPSGQPEYSAIQAANRTIRCRHPVLEERVRLRNRTEHRTQVRALRRVLSTGRTTQMVVLERSDWSAWLEQTENETDLLRALLAGSLKVEQVR
jgi:hypothetical protein